MEESSVCIFLLYLCIRTRAIPWRHFPAPAGAAAPRSRILFVGEDCPSCRGRISCGPRSVIPAPPLSFRRKQESSVVLVFSVVGAASHIFSCRGGISCRPKSPPRNGKTEGRMRCGHYRGGVPGGMSMFLAGIQGRACIFSCRGGIHVFSVVGATSHIFSCRGGISCRPKSPPRNGKTEGRMRCGHYRGGVPGGMSMFLAGIQCRASVVGGRHLIFSVVGAASHAARRVRQETERRKAA